MWIVFFLAAIAFAVWYAVDKYGLRTTGQNVSSTSTPVLEAEIVSDDEVISGLQIPKQWDEKFILEQLEQARNRPSVVGHYLDRLKERFVLRADNRTAQERIKFIRTVIEHLRVRKEFHVAVDDLQLHDLEREIRKRKLELEREGLESRSKAQGELADLELERDKLKLKVEMAQMTKEIDELNAPPPAPPPPPPPPPSREEGRKRKRAESEQRIKDLRRDKAADLVRLQAVGTSEEEIKRRENMWDDAIAREEEELRKWL